MKLCKILLAGALLLPLCVWAQEQEQENRFSMDMQLRTRAEYRNGALYPREKGDKPGSFINDRARIGFQYERDNLQIRFSGQHVGVWGQYPQTNKKGEFDLNEAWAKVKLGEGFFAQAGRQALVYDDERLLGGLDWNVAGRYHDALKLGYERNRHALHLILAFNQNDEKVDGGTFYAPGGQPYKNMQTLWYHAQPSQEFGISLLFMNLGIQAYDVLNGEYENEGTRCMQTLGTHLTYTPGSWNLHGSFYYQTGKSTEKESISAYMFSLGAGYGINSQWGVSVGTDYLSGDPVKDMEKGKVTTFNPLYGTHHKFYGTMDYFYATPYTSGLWDKYLGVRFKPCEKWNLSLNYHHFATTFKLDGYNRNLGSELDFQFDYVVAKDIRLSGGYSTMFGTKTMDVCKGGNHKSWQDWAWLSLNVNPRVFFAKW